MKKNRVIISPALEDILETVGENIKLARLRRKITATMLAERAGISRVTLRKVENGFQIGFVTSLLFMMEPYKG
jgi:transcriptional regulator with XRE-family HTH domain